MIVLRENDHPGKLEVDSKSFNYIINTYSDFEVFLTLRTIYLINKSNLTFWIGRREDLVGLNEQFIEVCLLPKLNNSVVVHTACFYLYSFEAKLTIETV